MRLLNIILVLVLALGGISISIPRVQRERDTVRKEEGLGLLLPSPIAKIAALEFKGLLADVLFSRAQTYYGGKLIRKEKLSKEEWDWIYRSMDLATDLDPYFWDPYYFGAMNLAWDAQRITEANDLLVKAARYRDWDWNSPFYLGFNYFFFLQDNDRAAYYLMEAAKRPGGANGLAPTLASRLAFEAKRTEIAVLFLEDIVRKTEDEATKKAFETRLKALKTILYLEIASTHFKRKFGRYPKSLGQLVDAGILRDIPQDPYGGAFYIDSQGTIKTTSDFVYSKSAK